MAIQSFQLPYSEDAVQDLRERLQRTRWPDTIPGSGWEYGFDLAYLQRICRYWREKYDWKAEIGRLASLHHQRYIAGDQSIHFVHERGRGPSPIPILLVHGWPGSFLEMRKLLPRLTDPAAHGGESSDSFDVVVPSLPGFGFSSRPTERGMNAARMADLFAELMTELGYERFACHGGDFGAEITSCLGRRHAPRIIGLHLNYTPGSYRPGLQPGAVLSREEAAVSRRRGSLVRKIGRIRSHSGSHARKPLPTDSMTLPLRWPPGSLKNSETGPTATATLKNASPGTNCWRISRFTG